MHRTALEDRRTGPVEGLRKPASILCPVDFSDESLATLARAMEIANRSGARLVALHVADPLLARAAAAAYHRSVVIEESTRALRDAVDHVRWETGSGNVDIAVKVALGDTASEICRFCRDHAVDLIVMGSHASGTYRHRLFGSVCECVLRTAPVPVLVFPHGPAGQASTMCVLRRFDDEASHQHGGGRTTRPRYSEE
jgi:nucleotide-binding universal stress UspA family protein